MNTRLSIDVLKSFQYLNVQKKSVSHTLFLVARHTINIGCHKQIFHDSLEIFILPDVNDVQPRLSRRKVRSVFHTLSLCAGCVSVCELLSSTREFGVCLITLYNSVFSHISEFVPKWPALYEIYNKTITHMKRQ